MPKRKRCKTTGIKKESHNDKKIKIKRKKWDRISTKQKKSRRSLYEDFSESLIEPARKKRKHTTLRKSRRRSKCQCNINGTAESRKDVKSQRKMSRVSEYSESTESVPSSRSKMPNKCNSIVTIYSSDSGRSYGNANYQSKSKSNLSQILLESKESQKYRSIAELGGVKFIQSNSGSTTEISFKPAVVMHVKKKSSYGSLSLERKKSDENIIVVNPSKDLLCDLGAGRVQRLYKNDTSDLFRQAVQNQSRASILSANKSVNFINPEPQQTAVRELPRLESSPSRLAQGSNCNILQVKSSKNFTNLQYHRSSQLSVKTSQFENNLQEILPPQLILNCSVNSLALSGPGWRGSEVNSNRNAGSTACLSDSAPSAHYGTGDRPNVTTSHSSSLKK